MNENNVTTMSTKGSFHASLRLTLDHMAENDYIGWDEDYDTRRDLFFDALASEDDATSTIEGGLRATFGDLDNALYMIAESMFYRAFNEGIAAPRGGNRIKRLRDTFAKPFRDSVDALKA